MSLPHVISLPPSRFADGEVEEGTLVVGADGCHSAVRRWRAPLTFSSSLLLSSLELSNTTIYEPYIRALLGTASHFCQVRRARLWWVPTGAILLSEGGESPLRCLPNRQLLYQDGISRARRLPPPWRQH